MPYHLLKQSICDTSLAIGLVIMIQTLPLPSLRNIAGLGLSDVRITLAGTISGKD